MKTVIVSGARAPAALDIMRAFATHGWRVIAADSVAMPPARFSRAVSRYVRLPGPALDRTAFASAVRRLADEVAPDLWIPTCEEIFHLAELKPAHFPDLPLVAPPFADLVAVHDKATFAEIAGRIGLAPAESIRVTDRAQLDDLKPRARDMVFKPVWSRFAERILIRPQPAALDSLHPSLSDPWIAQTYLPGEEVCTYGIAHQGRLLVHTAYHPRYRLRIGAGIYFDPAPDADIRAAVEALAGALRWSGQIAFDLRRDAAGAWKAIECNPRATSGVHLMPGDAIVEAMTWPATYATNILSPADASAVKPRPCMIRSAMFVIAGPAALWNGKTRAWWTDVTRARDALSIPGDRGPGLGQYLFFAENAYRALMGGHTITRAATYDMEWNGPELPPSTAMISKMESSEARR